MRGTGHAAALNPDALIPDPGAPVSAIQFPLENERIVSYLRDSLSKVVRKFQIDGKTPFEKLPAKAKEAFLYGNSGPGEFRGVGRRLESYLAAQANSRSTSEIGKFFSDRACPACGGSRLRPESRAVKINGMSIADYARLSLEDAYRAFSEIELTPREAQIAGQVLREIRGRMEFLLNVGVDYLSLDRPASSLPG